MTSAQTEPEFRIEPLTTPSALGQASDLYRAVFGYAHQSYGISPRLLAALAGNGGSVVGALDAEDRLVAFAYGFLGTDGTEIYHYSQAAVVAADQQGKGLGRQLKLAQREVALANGTTSMRWTYNPLLTRNAHFNLDVLNATGVRFYPDLYGDDGTDRIMIVWDLTADPAIRPDPEPLPELSPADWGTMITEPPAASHPERIVLALPSDIAALGTADPTRAAAVTDAVRDRLAEIFGRGYQAVSCRAAGDTAGYIFRPSLLTDPGGS